MTEIVLHSMAEYPVVVRRVLSNGERRAPRGLETIDLGFTTIVLLDPRCGMPLGLGRGLNPAIGAVEAAQLIAGMSTPKLVLKVAPQFSRYSEPNDDSAGIEHPYFWGAYGERIKLQAYSAIKKLTNDPHTRQAVITLWDPWLDNVEGKKDYPCTIALQFFIRDGLLDMNVIMRSNDVWLGLPYDVYQFTQLQASVARALNTTPGTYRHTALSLHLYERDHADALALWQNYQDNTGRLRKAHSESYQPDGIGRPGDSFADIMSRAMNILDNNPIDDSTESEKWYVRQLHKEHGAA
jgi:thymidylate synthase